MKYMVEIAKKENIHVKQLWLNALPPIIYIDGLKEKYEFAKTDFDVNPVIGEYDAPDLQQQGILTMPITKQGNWIVYGMADSGKDELISSFVYSCISTYSPDELNMYLLDFGSETLRMYRKAPQVGDVVFQSDNDKVINLFKMISTILESRRKEFAEYGGNYETYISTSGKTVPNIIVVINGFELFSENFGDLLLDSMITITRDCQKYGVYFVITSSSANGIRSKLAQYLPNHLVLQMNDKYDYSTLLARTKLEPAAISGRGLVKLDTVYEFQSAVPTVKEEMNSFMLEKIKELLNKYKNGAQKIPVLPDTVTISYCADSSLGLTGIPVGVEKESLAVRTLNVTKYMEHTITAMEFENVKVFGEMIIRQLAKQLNKNVYVFDTEKVYKNLASSLSYYDNNLSSCFKQLGEFFLKMYDEFEKGGYDTSSLNKYGEYVVVVVGIDKFKLLLGNDFNSIFNDLFVKIKAMPKVHLIIIDAIDNIKKMEYDPWYKSLVNPARGLWIGDGFSTQFSLKSTLPARQLAAKLDNSFGYYIDGSLTVLFKAITEIGEEEDYESL